MANTYQLLTHLLHQYFIHRLVLGHGLHALLFERAQLLVESVELRLQHGPLFLHRSATKSPNLLLFLPLLVTQDAALVLVLLILPQTLLSSREEELLGLARQVQGRAQALGPEAATSVASRMKIGVDELGLRSEERGLRV